MKYLYLLCFVILLSSCKKEQAYGPFNLRNGQEVELSVDHRYGAIYDQLLILPQNKDAEASLHGFDNRKPGYMYRVKARFHKEKVPLQDAADRWFDFIRVISEEKYKGNESFDIQLIHYYIPGGQSVLLNKENEKYVYIKDKLQLTYSSPEVKTKLEEIWQNVVEMRENWANGKPSAGPKWKFITATVTHDPSNFGKAYLVQKIEFTK